MGDAARKYREPQKIESILKGALSRFGVDKQIAKYNFVLHWAEIVGPEIAKRTVPEGIRGDTLTVRVANSTWAQELSFHKDIILKRLKKFTQSQEDVRDIFFVIGEVKSP